MHRIVEVPATPAMRLLARQRHLIALLQALGGDVPCVDFQKMLLLYCKSLGDAPPYEFVPYRFGAFSFTSYADRRKLAERSLLADADSWRLSAKGRQVARAIDLPAVDEFANRYRHLAGDDLVAETYRQFPYFASRSEIVSRVLRDDPATKRRIIAATPQPTGSPLMTIGYEGRSVEAYLNVLLRHGVTVLCDVRRNPLSRKYGFSKRSLMAACEGVGVRYRHLPELGIVGDRRRSLDTQADYDRLFADYERHDLPHQGEAITAIGTLLQAGERVALTCYEHLPHQCHRHCVAEAVERLTSCECGAVHL
jgi:hypothetical protein